MIRKYRTPIVVGAGGIAAAVAFTRARAQQQAIATAQTAASAPAGAVAGASGADAIGFAQAGADMLGRGVALGIAPTEQALALAGSVVGIAGDLAGASTGLAGLLGGTIGDLAGRAIDTLPSFAPAEGITPQPTTQPPAQQPPPPSQTPPPTQAPAPVRTFAGYEVAVSPGTYIYYDTAGRVRVAAQSFSSGSMAPVERRTDGGVLRWVVTAGAGRGKSYVPGLSGAFRIRKRYRWSDGRPDELVYIAQTGS